MFPRGKKIVTEAQVEPAASQSVTLWQIAAAIYIHS